MSSLIGSILEKHRRIFAKIIDIPLTVENVLPVDFTENNLALTTEIIQSSEKLEAYIQSELKDKNKLVAAGGYLEERVLYRRSPLFDQLGSSHRNIHLGIDLWTKANTKVYAPLSGKIIGLKDNNNFADYGPTIILEHELENLNFYSLYGHLSRISLKGKNLGDMIDKGQAFCEIGNYPENGDWSPHLHFQLMTDMLANEHDFPGTCSAKDKSHYKNICPDPNLILGIINL
jgi:murein DD-endopeptidase MepM/ murein hydrolase activator NlpD